MSIRLQALAALQMPQPTDKCRAVADIVFSADINTTAHYSDPTGLPYRPEKPVLVSALGVSRRSVKSREGRGAMVHALAHIELNAIDLALDIIWRFADMPSAFYMDWLSVAKEEALHFQMLETHLHSMDYAYGDFPAHNGLWEMAEKTRGNLLARLALVPRTLEARGLDASPVVREKLRSVGDLEGARILDVILRDEIGHVAIGNHWYNWQCVRQGQDPITAYARLAHDYHAPLPRGPFNWSARKAAGFSDAELAALQEISVR